MSTPMQPKQAKLVIGLLMKDKSLLESVSGQLFQKFGTADIISSWFNFDYTNYYEPELGMPLFRRMFSFKTLIEQSDLADIKLFSNQIESSFSENGKRRVNIDPGYMLAERFVLGTGKNYTHRIFIGKGIYADLTLIYQNKDFRTLPWTYPDYADSVMLAFLTKIRNKYLADVKTSEGSKTL